MKKIIFTYIYTIIDILIAIRIKLIFFSSKKPPIIILTPGKVGSSTIYKTLKKQIKNPIFHVHVLNSQKIENSFQKHKDEGWTIPFHLFVSKHLSKKINNYNKEIFIITLIREPISRMISSYFQNIERYNNYDDSIDKALKSIKNHIADSVEYYEKWFQTEIKSNFNIDIYEKKFQKNYIIYNKNEVNFLLIRMEDINEYFIISFNEFMKRNNHIRLIDSNVGSKKKYSEIYNKVKKKIEIDREIIKEIESTRFMNTFYSDQL